MNKIKFLTVLHLNKWDHHISITSIPVYRKKNMYIYSGTSGHQINDADGVYVEP